MEKQQLLTGWANQMESLVIITRSAKNARCLTNIRQLFLANTTECQPQNDFCCFEASTGPPLQYLLNCKVFCIDALSIKWSSSYEFAGKTLSAFVCPKVRHHDGVVRTPDTRNKDRLITELQQAAMENILYEYTFQLPAPQSGTLSRISSGTRPSVQTVSDICLKRICSLDTSAFSALEVLDDNCINLLTYLLSFVINTVQIFQRSI